MISIFHRHLTAFVILAGLLQVAADSYAQSPATLLSPPPGDRPVEVEAGFRLLSISEINDETETVEFSGVLTLSWHDPRQAFDPAEVGAVERVFTGSYQFNELSPAWYPQVILANPAGLYDSRAVVLRVRPDGTCQMTEAIDASAKVTLNLRSYPFDRQKMDAVFQMLGFGADEVRLRTTPSSSTANPAAIRVPQWHFDGVATSIRTTDTGSTAFVVSIEVKRRSLFMLRLVVVPLGLIVMLSWSVFWMDRSSLGDRMAVSFVGILTAVAYQIVLSDTLPKISYITAMNAFLNCSLILMCATVILNLVVRDSDKRGDTERSLTIDLRCRWIFPIAYAGIAALIAIIALIFF